MWGRDLACYLWPQWQGGTDVSDVREGGESVPAHSSVGTWRLGDSKPHNLGRNQNFPTTFFFFSNFKRHIFYQEFNNQWWIVTFLKTAHGVSRLPIFVWWVVVMIYHGYRRYLYIQQHVRLHLPSVKWDGKQQVLVSSDRLEFSSSVVYFRAVHLFFPVVYTISWKVWPVTATNKAIKILGGGAANISKGSDSLFHLGPHNPLHINPAHIFRFAGKHSGHY